MTVRDLATFAESDLSTMAVALKLARRGEGLVEPNPMVGCVVVTDGQIIGQGHHRRFGVPHAEIEALRSCTSSPAGATVYCTLEPCAHFGKTPPCTAALIEAGVSRVVIPQLDPNPAVNGRGVRALRRAGIEELIAGQFHADHVAVAADEASAGSDRANTVPSIGATEADDSPSNTNPVSGLHPLQM